MKDYIRDMLMRRKDGIVCGIPSFCTANWLVIEACLEQAKRFDDYVLIEATANQVNQFGGYTGMRPEDFRDFVYQIADQIAFPREQIILGGDHLGPLTWQDEPEMEAMGKAVELVKLFVRAGFKKIHLDTSMRVADDPKNEALSDQTIARRGAILYKACEEAYQELLERNPEEVRPVFVIGSEVPVPGGAQQKEDGIQVTKPQALESTLRAYQEAFQNQGISNAFAHIIGVVVQPGVEFGDGDTFVYDRASAKELTACARKHKNIVLEGHSTDYQPAKALREMVEDGIAILKVGPALTFALREGLYALSCMEKMLVPEENRANFIETLEQSMLENPGNWIKHYHGNDEQLKVKRVFSYSDRCRYYFAQPEIIMAVDKLLANMSRVEIPMGMLHQYLPYQYFKVRDGKLSRDAKALVKDCVVCVVEDYNYATKLGYEIANIKI